MCTSDLMEIQANGSLLPIVPKSANTLADLPVTMLNKAEQPVLSPDLPVPSNEAAAAAPLPPNPNALAPRAPQMNKWAELLQHEQSTHMYHTPEHFKDGLTEQDIDNTIHEQSWHQAFIAYMSQSKFSRSSGLIHLKRCRTELKTSHLKHIASHPNASKGITMES